MTVKSIHGHLNASHITPYYLNEFFFFFYTCLMKGTIVHEFTPVFTPAMSQFCGNMASTVLTHCLSITFFINSTHLETADRSFTVGVLKVKFFPIFS